jgi:hypothetical protein
VAAKKLSATIRMAISAKRKMASAGWPLPYLAGTAYRAGLKTSRRIAAMVTAMKTMVAA